MKHSEQVERQVEELLDRGHTVAEVAHHLGLPDRTVRDMANRLGIEPASARPGVGPEVSAGVQSDMVAIVANARATLEDLSEKIRRGPSDTAPKYATAYATVLRGLAGLGVQPVAKAEREVEPVEVEERNGVALDFGMERMADEVAFEVTDEAEDAEDDKTPSNRDRLIRMHTERAMQLDDPVARLKSLGMAVGNAPGLTPGDAIRLREQQGTDNPNEALDAMVMEKANARGPGDQ